VEKNFPPNCLNSLGNTVIKKCTFTNNKCDYVAVRQIRSCNKLCRSHGSLVFYFSLTVVVTFSKNDSDKVLITVDVTEEADGACNNITLWHNRTDVEWTLCSEKYKPESCEKLCGVGTGRASPVTDGM
jgi:hypothetical protein